MLPEALEAMTEELAQVGNPSSLHNAGRRARRVVEESREQIAEAFGARPSEVIFTSGGTEADNLAVKGLFWARRAADAGGRRVLATADRAPRGARHASQWLAEHEGAEVGWLPVDSAGLVSPDGAARAIEADPGPSPWSASCGPTTRSAPSSRSRELAAVAREHGIPFHSDAVQAAGQLPVDFAATGADALTHHRAQDRRAGRRRARCCWPAASSWCRCCTAAARSATSGRAPSTPRRSGLRGRGRARRPARDDEAAAGRAARRPDRGRSWPPSRTRCSTGRRPGRARLPGNAHFSFPGCEGDALLMLLDAKGIACSTGSACTAGVAQPSHVLLAMGADEARARGSLRFSLGPPRAPRPTWTRSAR